MGFNLAKNVHYSTANSSTTPLAASGVFTGEWEDVGAFSDIIVSIATDQNGTYSIQYSPDGVFQDSTLTRYHKTEEINVPHRFTNTRRFVRVVFTNTSDTDQTYFRMQTSFGDRHPLNVPLDGTVAQDYDAIITRPTDYQTEVVLGRRQGHRHYNKFGYNNDVDSAAEETIWPVGGRAPRPTTARTLSIVSDSSEDAVGGNGATGVVIYGLDENRRPAVGVQTLTGVTPAVTTSTWLGINRMAVYATDGTGTSNAGNITATFTTEGTTAAYMPAGDGTTQQCIYFVSAGASALIQGLFFSVRKLSGGTAPRATVYIRSYSFVSRSYYEVFRWNMDANVENTFTYAPVIPFPVTEQSMIEVTATTNTNDTVVSARLDLIEIDDADT